MTYILSTIQDINRNFNRTRPDICQENCFSNVIECSKQKNGTIVPPTRNEFMEIWNQYNSRPIKAHGYGIDELKQNLKTNCFQPINDDKKIKTITWTRMIIAFNIYAFIRRTINLYPFFNINLIGSAENNTIYRKHCNCEYNCGYYNVLFLNNNTINRFINFTEFNSKDKFWDNIFNVYDNIDHTSIEPKLTIEKEYFNRKKNNTRISISNKQIAYIILRSQHELPQEIKKHIYKICKQLK
jgi:hypothetical protein